MNRRSTRASAFTGPGNREWSALSSVVSYVRQRLRRIVFGSRVPGMPSIDFGTSAVRLLDVPEAPGAPGDPQPDILDSRRVDERDGLPPRPEDYSSPLEDLLVGYDLEGRPVIVGVPLRSTIVRRLAVSTASGDRLGDRVRRKARDTVPVSLGDVHFDYQVVAREGGTLRLILVMIKKETLREYLTVVREAGLNPGAVEVSSFALFNLYCSIDRRGDTKRDGTAILVDVGAHSTDLLAFEGREVLYGRSLSEGGYSVTRSLARQRGISIRRARRLKHGSVDLFADPEGSGTPPGADLGENQPGQNRDHPSADESDGSSSSEGSNADDRRAARAGIKRLVVELRQTLDYLENEVGSGPVRTLILCGGGSLLSGFDRHLESRLGRPCRTFRPAGLAGGTVGPEERPSWLVSFGLQRRNRPDPGPVELNLMPASRNGREPAGTRRGYRRAAAALVGLLVVQLLVGFLLSYERRRDHLAESERALRSLEPALKRINRLRDRRESLRSRVDRLRELERNQVPMLALIGDLGNWPRTLRRESWVRSLRYSSNEPHGRLAIEGVTRDFRNVSWIYRWMEKRPYVLRRTRERQSRSDYRLGGRTASMVRFSATYSVSFGAVSARPLGKGTLREVSRERGGEAP